MTEIFSFSFFNRELNAQRNQITDCMRRLLGQGDEANKNRKYAYRTVLLTLETLIIRKD